MRTVHIRQPHGTDQRSDQHNSTQNELLRFTGFIRIGNITHSAAVDYRSRHDSLDMPVLNSSPIVRFA
ncbi:MAG TPA: hypothetical protein DCY03_23190 [Planctomycetaceae bacterium]|nr:hypothetical protein [Planctomycetaceae bacterium]